MLLKPHNSQPQTQILFTVEILLVLLKVYNKPQITMERILLVHPQARVHLHIAINRHQYKIQTNPLIMYNIRVEILLVLLKVYNKTQITMERILLVHPQARVHLHIPLNRHQYNIQTNPPLMYNIPQLTTESILVQKQVPGRHKNQIAKLLFLARHWDQIIIQFLA